MWLRFPRPRLRAYLDAPITAHRVAWGLTGLLAVGLSGATAYWFGYDHALQSVGASAAEVQAMRADGRRLQQESAALRQALALAQQERDLARQTAARLQEDSKTELDELAALREQLVSYQRMLGEKGVNGGLAVEHIRFKAAGAGQYDYRLLLTQVAQNTTEIGGTATVRVLGVNGVAPALSREFRFQYFQALSGRLSLPAGFVPQSVEVTLQSTGRKAGRIQRRFKWEVGG